MDERYGRWASARALVLATTFALFAACATEPRLVRTEVTSFDAWGTLPAERSFVFVRTLEYQNSLEMQSYENIVRDELQLRGFTLAPSAGDAALAVTLRPSVLSAQLRVREPFLDPWWGGWGGFGPWGYGGPRAGYGWGGWYGPYGFGGGLGTLDDYTIYRRRLELDIDSRTTAGTRYYEGRVENTGASDALQTVMPSLIRALFTDFPGNSGQTRRIDVPAGPG